MKNIRKRFGATQALAGVDLQVLPGEVMAVVGENGAGKSTLMTVISGAIAADEGQMFLEGKRYTPRSPLDARRAGIAMIYQELSLAPHLSVMENIFLGAEPVAGPLVRWRHMRQRAAEALAEVGLPDVPPELPIRRLSAAQQQLVEIARAVALQCRILVLDEPTSSLTQRDAEQLFALIRRLRSDGISAIYISHFLEEIQTISDRFTVLRDGESVGQGTTSEADVPQIVAMMVGRQVEDLFPRSRHRQPGKVLLEVSNLAGRTKPADASFRLRRGWVLGIAGLMGAGRTELVRAVFGLDPVRLGTVRVGAFRGIASPGLRWKQRVGMVSEDRKHEGLARDLSLADNLTLPHLERLGPWRFVLPSRQCAAAQPWIDRLGIKCTAATQPAATLSGGNQQKLALARLLHADVDVLLLDEPTRGIDVGSKAEIYRLIDELASGDSTAGRLPKAILIVGSYLPELLGVCDEIAVMCRGQLGPARPVAQWSEHELMMAAIGQSVNRS